MDLPRCSEAGSNRGVGNLYWLAEAYHDPQKKYSDRDIHTMPDSERPDNGFVYVVG